MKGYEDCKCGSKETYISFAGDVCCYPCFKPLAKAVETKEDTTARIVPDPDGWSVKINGELKKYFSKYECYAYTEAREYARQLNNFKG